MQNSPFKQTYQQDNYSCTMVCMDTGRCNNIIVRYSCLNIISAERSGIGPSRNDQPPRTLDRARAQLADVTTAQLCSDRNPI